VRVYAAADGGESRRRAGGRWVIEVRPAGGAARLRLCASVRGHADAWAVQLRRRTAPWVEWWGRLPPAVPTAGGDGRDGDGGDTAARQPAAAAAGPSAAAALSQVAVKRLVEDVRAGVVGVATAVTRDAHALLDVAGGPLADVGLDTLLFVGRVFVHVRQAPGVAAELSDRVHDLSTSLTRLVVPAVQTVDGALELLGALGSLVADLEVLAGALHHLVRSRRRRVEHGVSAAASGGPPSLVAALDACERQAASLLPLVAVAQGAATRAGVGRLEDAVLAASLRAARMPLPERPPAVYVDWDDGASPPVQLYDACMGDGSSASSAVAAEGMGGVGKTLTCLLVAHRVAEGEAGRRRFPGGVHWVQLSQDADEADVKRWVCAVATTVAGAPVDAVDLRAAEARLRAALAPHACLLVVDDVWRHDWLTVFLRALADSAASSVLFSTRNAAIGGQEGVGRSGFLGAEVGRRAEGVLIAHATVGGAVSLDQSDARVRQGVLLCGGLPLALAVLGALVRKFGWAGALWRVEEDKHELLSKRARDCPIGHQSLWPSLQASQTGLGNTDDTRALWRQRFLALCIVAIKEKVPLSALQLLWGEPVAATKRIAVKLRDAALVTLHDEAGALRLSMHDLVVDYLAHEDTMGHSERSEVHARLVDAYCRRDGVTDEERVANGGGNVTVRPLHKLRSDGFLRGALPRLLVGGGCQDELGVLLCDMAFIAWRVTVAGGDCSLYRKDCRTARLPALYRVATVVEGATGGNAYTSHALQRAAWRIRELFASGGTGETHGLVAQRAAHLGRTAFAFLPGPSIHLYGASRLVMPLERHVWRLGYQHSPVCAVACGRVAYVIVSEKGGLLKVFDAESGVDDGSLVGHTDYVPCLAALPDGRSDGGKLVSGSKDCTVRVWDVENKQAVAVLEGHTATVTCVAVAGGDGGTRIVSGSSDGSVRVWDGDSLSLVWVLVGHDRSVRHLVMVGGDGGGDGGGSARRVVSGSYDGTVRVWDVDTGERGYVFCSDDNVSCVAAVGDTARVVSGGWGGTVRVWDVGKPSAVAELDCGQGEIRGLAVVGAGAGAGSKRLVIATEDGTLATWDMVSGSPWRTLHHYSGSLTCLLPVRGGPLVLASSSGGLVWVWDAIRGAAVTVLKGHAEAVHGLLAVPASSGCSAARAVSCSEDQTARLWELSDLTVPRDAAAESAAPPLGGHELQVTCLVVATRACGDMGTRVVSGSRDGSLRVWDVDGGTPVAALQADGAAVLALTVIRGDDGGRGAGVVSVSDRRVRVWDLSSMSEVDTFPTDCVRSVVTVGGNASGRGTQVVCGAYDKTVRVWDVDQRKEVAVLTGHTASVLCLAVVNDGVDGGRVLVASGSDDGTVRVWDITSGSTVAVLPDLGRVTCLATVSDGVGHCLGGSSRASSFAWDTTTWAPIWTRVHQQSGWRRVFSAPPSKAGAAATAGAADPGGETLFTRRCMAVAVRLNGQCVTIDLADGSEEVLPGPDANAACIPASDIVALGTDGGDVLFGRIH